MYWMICAVAALLVAAAARPATADDFDVCKQRGTDDAIAACNRVVAEYPKDSNLYIVRGAAYACKGDFDHVISGYDQAIRLNPKGKNAYFLRGAMYSKRGDDDRAITDYGQAIQLGLNDAPAYVARGNSYLRRLNTTTRLPIATRRSGSNRNLLLPIATAAGPTKQRTISAMRSLTTIRR